MNIIRNILYGLISGITEFLPVSLRGHQALVRYLFGIETRDPMLDLLVHIGILLSIFISCREILLRLYRQQRSLSLSRRRKGRLQDSKSYYDLRLLKTATVPLLIGQLLCLVTPQMENNLLVVMAFFLLNASVLLAVEHVRHGNRDARTMTGLDGIVIGAIGALSVFPGISRTGMTAGYAVARGAGRQNAANWAILLCIPALLIMMCFEVLIMVNSGIGILSFAVFASYLLAAIAAFCGGYLGVSLLQLVLNHFGFSGFAYYSYGTAFFAFILYLLT